MRVKSIEEVHWTYVELNNRKLLYNEKNSPIYHNKA